MDPDSSRIKKDVPFRDQIDLRTLTSVASRMVADETINPCHSVSYLWGTEVERAFVRLGITVASNGRSSTSQLAQPGATQAERLFERSEEEGSKDARSESKNWREDSRWQRYHHRGAPGCG